MQSINGPDNGTVRIPAIEADKILLNGSEIIPGSNNIPGNLGTFNTISKDDKNAITIHTARDDENTHTDLSNDSGPKAIVDFNFIGKMGFYTVRPIVIDKSWIDTFVPTSSTGSGAGRFVLPLPDVDADDNYTLNPYGFSVLDRTATTTADGLKPPAVISSSNVVDNAANVYGVKEVDFRWIRYYKNGDVVKYKVYAKGKVIFFLNPKCCKCLNMQWVFDPSKDKVTGYIEPTDYTLEKEFVYVDGFSFSCLCKNKNEQLSYYGTSEYK